MEHRPGLIAVPDSGRRLLDYWQNPAVRAVLQILFLIGMGTLAAFAKNASPSLGIPGSSAPLWLAPLVLGRALVRRDGAGALMGVSVAVMGIPIGLNNPFMHNLYLYGLAGVALDIGSRLPKIMITTWYGAMICGILAHLVKFGYIFSASFFSATTKHFILLGVFQSLGLHIAFGVAAGLVAWAVYRGIKLARSR
jgi:hypothetical protein